MFLPILLGALVGLLIGFMIGFTAFGVWGGVIGALVGLLAGSLIITTLRKVALTDAPDAAGGTKEIAGTKFRADARADADDPNAAR